MSWIEHQFGKFYLKAQKAFFPSEKDLITEKMISQFEISRYSHLMYLLSSKDIKVHFSAIQNILLTKTDIYFPQVVLLREDFENIIFYLILNISQQFSLGQVINASLALSDSEIEFCQTLITGLKTEFHAEEIATFDLRNTKSNNSKKESLKAQAIPNPNSVDLSSTPDNPLIHMFEKVQTAEEYDNGSRSIEDAESLSSESQALDEVLFGTVIRTHETSSGMLETDVSVGKQSGKGEGDGVFVGKCFFYKEWFERESKYHDNWCKVFVKEWEGSNHLESNNLLPKKKVELAKRLKLELDYCLNVSRLQKREPNGDDLDIDAIVNARADFLATGVTTSHIYEARQNLERDFGVLFLLDKSMSTDAWLVEGRVIDLIQEALLILDDSFSAIKENIQIDFFHSYTRNDCHYQHLKKFEDSWDRWSEKVQSILPEGYTRIGPAIRHANHELQNRKFKKKILIILSDCKPTDYDAYEGSHGMADVKKAVSEAQQLGIHCFAFALTKQIDPWTLKMFNKNRFANISKTSRFVEEIVKVLHAILKK